MLTEWGRRSFRGLFEAVAQIFKTLHITPNMITLSGLLLNCVVAYLIIAGRIQAAGVLYIFAAGFDAIDGTLARMVGVRSRFGAFWDSTLDRMGEAIVISAVGVWAALQGDAMGVGLAFAALTTSYLVSYTRARAEGLGLDTKVGFGTRVERYLVMVLALITGYAVIGLAIIAVIAGVTVLQRIYDVWRQANRSS